MAEKQIGSKAGNGAAKKATVAIVLFSGIAAAFLLIQPDTVIVWVKAFHVIAVISWMAGLLYLPRLFIYHTDAEPGSKQSETFKVMEQRLLKVIMNPAMMISWVLGLYLSWSLYAFQGGWLHAKILCVVLLTATHVFFSRSIRAFARDENQRSARSWRMINEIPTVLMIGIVILVIVKPF